MVQRVEVEVDDQGRIGLPAAVRDRLGLTAGMTLVVEQDAEETTYLRVREDSPRLVDRGGVLVVEGELIATMDDLVRRERDGRIEELVRRAVL